MRKYLKSILFLVSVPVLASAHGVDLSPSSAGGSRKKADQPRYKSEAAALEEMSFLVRDIGERMRRGDVEGVHHGAWEISVSADNLWTLGEKRHAGARNRSTINGYMNLLKTASKELEAFNGKEDMEAGNAQLAKVREVFALLKSQYSQGPDSHPVAPIPGDSGLGRIPAKIDSARSDSLTSDVPR